MISRKSPQIAIIILNWNGWKNTIECLESLFQITYPNYIVILIDNGSEDDSLEQIESYCGGKIEIDSKFFDYTLKNKPIKIIEYSREEVKTLKSRIDENLTNPGLFLIKNEKNYGFAEGNNIGIRFALTSLNPAYILLLNNDTVVDPHFLDYLVKKMENNEKIGFCSPKIYFYDFKGTRNIINFAGGRIDMWRGISSHIGITQPDIGQYNFEKEVDWCEGSCLLVRVKTIQQIGLLDPKYFAYWEDTDWCLQGKKRGWQSWFVPESKIWHKINASSNKKSGFYYYFMTRNRIYFMKKNSNQSQFLFFKIYFCMIDFIKEMAILFLKRNHISIRCYLKSIVDGFHT
jgi:GT2 family glycosyltransferase